eukprot:gene16798-18493_t
MEEKSEARQEPSSYEDATKNFEYSRLRILIPKLAAKESVSKIEVVEEAINYIAQLQNTLSSYHDATVFRTREKKKHVDKGKEPKNTLVFAKSKQTKAEDTTRSSQCPSFATLRSVSLLHYIQIISRYGASSSHLSCDKCDEGEILRFIQLPERGICPSTLVIIFVEYICTWYEERIRTLRVVILVVDDNQPRNEDVDIGQSE